MEDAYGKTTSINRERSTVRRPVLVLLRVAPSQIAVDTYRQSDSNEGNGRRLTLFD
ncbi:unnamed protein product [Haemonchus placei]|uniref:Uncharacterized protein n=1 Tax=Haemonchus placei TaxID=6290 RepID=A0A3P7W4J0_HAEPC|nr:unnamed protein product [Haemonchus placei]